MKLLLYILMSIIICSSGLALAFTGGSDINIHNITTCDGPVSIKVTSEAGVGADEFSIDNCRQETNYTWSCECKGAFPINIYFSNTTHNIYDFTINYYIKYNNRQQSNGREPDLNDIREDNNARIYKIIDVVVTPFNPPRVPFELNIETKNALLFGVGVFIIIIATILFRWRKYFGTSPKDNHDVMNYKVKNEEDIDDILNNIK